MPSLLFGAVVRAGGTCKGKDCWKAIGGGYKYVDPDVTSDGIKKIIMKGNATTAGKAKFIVIGKKDALPFPPAMLPMDQDTKVTAQMSNSDGFCWDADHSTNIKNDPELFKAKSD